MKEQSRLYASAAVVLGAGILAAVPRAAADSLDQAQQRVKAHAQHVLGELNQKEQAFRSLAQQEQEKWRRGKMYNLDNRQIEGPEEHPWIKADRETGANPNSEEDYKQDSKNAWDNPQFLKETWSCFEPQLVAFGECTRPPIMAEIDLGLTCQAHCCADEWANPFDPDRWEEKFEVVQFWFPEHQAAVNNYARMRLNPRFYPNGQEFIRRRLLDQKRNVPEKLIKDELEETYPLSLAKFKEPTREEPYKGQEHWGGAPGNFNDQLSAHVYRTHIAVKVGNEAPHTREGWDPEKKSIFDALPPGTDEKQLLNYWSEYGVFDAISSIDSLSFVYFREQRVQDIMRALLERRGDALERAKEDPAFYQSQGAAAFRIARWSDVFRPLQEIAEINPDNEPALREAVYYGGTELYPMSLTLEGFEVPELNVRGTVARRAFEISGMKEMEKFLIGREKARINTFTINGDDKGREIDKIQLIAPFARDKTPAECIRSQKLPSMVAQSEDQWTHKNYPHDMMGYVKEDNSDSAHIYWNKRVACSCKRDAAVGYGSVAMNFPPDKFGEGRGDGDRIYGRMENVLCTYREGQLPSAFAGQDQPTCLTNPNTEKYEGIDDNI